MDALLAGKQGERLLRSSIPEFEHDAFQLRVLLAVDAVQVGGFQTCFLQFLEHPSGLDAQVLSDLAGVWIVVADQQHMILGPERVEESTHLFRRVSRQSIR
jgi:hypothetical protein